MGLFGACLLGQSTNIARRWGRRSILATLSAPVLRNLRRARVKELAAARGGSCRTRGGSQGRGKGFSRFGYRWRLNRSKGQCRLSSPGSRRGRPPRWFSLSSRRCRIRFGRTPLIPNISRIQALAGWRIQGDLRGHSTDEARGSANERLVKVGHWHQPTTGPQRSTERQLGAFCQSCDGDSFSARTVCNRDAESQWLASEAFLVFDSEMCRRTQ